MDLKELYQDIILEHGKNPRNFGKCSGHSHEAKGHNPLCGDQVKVYLKLNQDKNVDQVTFEGSGCAISMASTSSIG
jgi:nitrogen fixation NifU-like protein